MCRYHKSTIKTSLQVQLNSYYFFITKYDNSYRNLSFSISKCSSIILDQTAIPSYYHKYLNNKYLGADISIIHKDNFLNYTQCALCKLKFNKLIFHRIVV